MAIETLVGAKNGFSQVISPVNLRVPTHYCDLNFDAALSPSYLDTIGAVMYAAQRGQEHNVIAVPSSIPEEAAFRAESASSTVISRIGQSLLPYTTSRTPLFHFPSEDGSKLLIAASDSYDPEENILLARAEEAARAFLTSAYWVVERDGLVERMLERAHDEHRIARIPNHTTPYKESVRGGSESRAAKNGVLRVFFGDVLPAYAAFLDEHKYNTLEASLSGERIKGLLPGQAAIRPLSLGGHTVLNRVFYNYGKVIIGQCRAVAH